MRYGLRRPLESLACLLFVALALMTGSLAHAQTTTSYTYDSLGRVTSVTYAGTTTTYTYDTAGNRTQVVTSAAPTAGAVTLSVSTNSSGNAVPLIVSGPYTSVSVSTGPAHGSAAASGSTISYTPTAGYSGPDSFAYTATNSSGTSTPGTVTVAVIPVANNVSDTVAYDSTGNSLPLSVTGAYSASAVASFPNHGVATASGALVYYSPSTSYFGADSFNYTVSNALGSSAPATITITVNPQIPVANPVSATVGGNTINNNVPLSFGGGTPTSVAVSTAPSHGSAAATGTSITYTPTSGYVGSDSFQYTASNAGGTSPPGTASITVLTPIPDGTVMFSSSIGGSAYSFPIPVNAPGFVTVTLYGGGGGGYGSPSNHYGGGGGGYTTLHFAVTPGITVLSGLVGAYGQGAFHPSQFPGPGGPTTLSSPSMTANGGAGGTVSAGGAGGTASGGSTNITGQAGNVAGANYGGANLGPGGGAAAPPGSPGNPPGGGGSVPTSGPPPLTGENGATGEVIIVAHTT